MKCCALNRGCRRAPARCRAPAQWHWGRFLQVPPNSTKDFLPQTAQGKAQPRGDVLEPAVSVLLASGMKDRVF